MKRSGPLRRLVLLLAAFAELSGFWLMNRAEAQTARFRESVNVGRDAQVVRTLETAREHMAGQRWDEVVPLLQQQIETQGDSIVPVETGRYLNTATACHLLLAALPPEGLATYRQRVDPQARDLFHEGQERLDERPLRRIVTNLFCSSFGDDALWLLGELAFERGSFDQARQSWELLVPPVAGPDSDMPSSSRHLTFPDSQFAPAEVRFRLILCSLVERDAARAGQELAVFERLHAEEQTTVAGTKIRMVDWLRRELQALQNNAPARTETVSSGVDAPDLAAVLWSRTLPENRFLGPSLRLTAGGSRPLATYPLVHDDTVFVAGSDSIFAFDLRSGQPKWPANGSDNGEIFTNTLDRPWRPHMPLAGVAAYTMTLSDGRLYARTGPPLLRRSRNEGNAFSEIVGLDVAGRQGELVFHVTSEVLDPDAESPEATNWTFEGTPVVEDGRVYVSLRQGSPEDQVFVVCFDAETSRLIWSRRVCSSLKNVPDHFNEIGHRQLTLADGRLFLATDSGAIAALEARTGRLLWIVTYPGLAEETPAEMSDPRRHGLSSCLHHQGVVYAAPADSSQLFALDAVTGEAVWVQPAPERILHLTGVVDGRLIVCGASLWALNTQNGEMAWPERRVGFNDPGSAGFGRGVLTSRHIYWPLHDGLLQVDHRTGRIVDRVELREAFGQTGGHLLIANNILLIAQTDRLVALGPEPKEPETPPLPSMKREFGWKLPVRDAALPISDTPESTPLWPARRIWTRPIEGSASVLWPARSSLDPASATGSSLLIAERCELRSLDLRTGRDRWRVHLEQTPRQALQSGSQLILVSDDGLQSRADSTGQFQWRYESPTDDRVCKARLLADQFVLLVTDRVVEILSLERGEVVWSYPARDAAGTVSCSAALRRDSLNRRMRRSEWFESNALALFRSDRGRHGVVLDFSGGLGFPCEWPEQQPLLLSGGAGGNPESITLNDLTLQARPLVPPQSGVVSGVMWSHRFENVTFGRPVLLTNHQTLVVIEDGREAVRIDAVSGIVQWRQSLGPLPLHDVSSETLLLKDLLIAVSDGALRAFALKDGALKWTRWAGRNRWKLRESGEAVACLPLHRTSNQPEEPVPIMLCRAPDGAVIQRIPVSASVTPELWNDSRFATVRSGSELHGLLAMSDAMSPAP